jgi:hypothetical protein
VRCGRGATILPDEAVHVHRVVVRRAAIPAAGRVAYVVLDLTPREYLELNQPGTFTVEWAYSSDSHFPAITWTGALPPAKTTWQPR